MSDEFRFYDDDECVWGPPLKRSAGGVHVDLDALSKWLVGRSATQIRLVGEGSYGAVPGFHAEIDSTPPPPPR